MHISEERLLVQTIRDILSERQLPGEATPPAQLSPFERSQYLAAINWLQRYRAKPNAPNIMQVQGWLEAAYHLRALENYRLAYEILWVTPRVAHKIAEGEPLHELLGLWGHGVERLALYEGLLGKLPPNQEMRLLDGMGHTHHGLGDYAAALRDCDRYQKVLEQLNDDRLWGRLWGLLGITHHAMGAFDKAVEFQQRRLALSQRVGDRREQAYAWGDLGVAYYSLGEYGTARTCHEEQLALSEQINDAVQMRSALGSLGHVDQALGAFDRAIAAYQWLRTLAEEVGDRVRAYGALSGLGNVYRLIGRYDEALLAYESCLVNAREMGQRRNEAVALMGLALAHNAMGLSERAQAVAQEALMIVQSLQSDSLKAQMVQLLGQIAVSLQNYEAAIEYAVEALSLFEAMGDRPNEGLALFNLGGVMVALGETDDVFGCWLRSLMVFIELGLEFRIQTVVRALYGYLCHAVDSTFLDQPVTAERVWSVWKVPLDAMAEEYGQEAVTAMVACLVKWEQAEG